MSRDRKDDVCQEFGRYGRQRRLHFVMSNCFFQDVSERNNGLMMSYLKQAFENNETELTDFRPSMKNPVIYFFTANKYLVSKNFTFGMQWTESEVTIEKVFGISPLIKWFPARRATRSDYQLDNVKDEMKENKLVIPKNHCLMMIARGHAVLEIFGKRIRYDDSPHHLASLSQNTVAQPSTSQQRHVRSSVCHNNGYVPRLHSDLPLLLLLKTASRHSESLVNGEKFLTLHFSDGSFFSLPVPNVPSRLHSSRFSASTSGIPRNSSPVENSPVVHATKSTRYNPYSVGQLHRASVPTIDINSAPNCPENKSSSQDVEAAEPTSSEKCLDNRDQKLMSEDH